jgi:hypothetical protein
MARTEKIFVNVEPSKSPSKPVPTVVTVEPTNSASQEVTVHVSVAQEPKNRPTTFVGEESAKAAVQANLQSSRVMTRIALSGFPRREKPKEK